MNQVEMLLQEWNYDRDAHGEYYEVSRIEWLNDFAERTLIECARLRGLLDRPVHRLDDEGEDDDVEGKEPAFDPSYERHTISIVTNGPYDLLTTGAE